ncbi:hypothetical protein SISNIDRAFT_412530 [Sistotremastrum niveocremeum HHB9708]|uniref:Uncharacterized protein n=1 Tax=Sistotremastrum niveocremeum HHB9708 TaxID=1314777 RepID=A0A164TRA9_9AGAM|nr:hypothetical protein SISNIDRAFT_412530 [Sistotremastrum niveocremeum HHB9708]
MPLHPVPRNADEVSRHLLKFIFPKEFGLKCVFTEPRRPKSDPLCMDDDTKEKEIKVLLSRSFKTLSSFLRCDQRVGPIKTPKRLKGLLPLVHQLLRRHKKCKYKVLLSLTCRRKVRYIDGECIRR